MRIAAFILLALLAAAPAATAQKAFTLRADPELVDSGALAHLLPRFSLKTQVRVTLTDGEADAALGVAPSPAEAAIPVFQSADGAAVYRLAIFETDARAHAERFRDWLTSDIGVRTVTRFDPGDGPIFARVEKRAVQVAVETPEGDPVLGERIALRRCGRCHVISDKNRFGGIGSTPSFGALRTLPRWRQRFEAFWTLNPHPAFTQVEGMTEPFDPQRPSPIAPLKLTLDEVEAILAFVILMKPKDLGPPLVEQ